MDNFFFYFFLGEGWIVVLYISAYELKTNIRNNLRHHSSIPYKNKKKEGKIKKVGLFWFKETYSMGTGLMSLGGTEKKRAEGFGFRHGKRVGTSLSVHGLKKSEMGACGWERERDFLQGKLVLGQPCVA